MVFLLIRSGAKFLLLSKSCHNGKNPHKRQARRAKSHGGSLAGNLSCNVLGLYNMGYFGLDYMAKGGFTSTGDWHNWLIQLAGTDVNNHFHRFWFGLVYFVPIYVTVFVVGIACEAIFATIRRHEINEGAFVSTVLFSLSCPPDIPLWQAATGIAFGIVVGKEFFGGTGKNFLNPALTGRAFIYFAYPSELSGDMVWVASLADNGAIDGYSGATALGIGALEGLAGMQANFTWGETFFGQIPGSIGETSTFLILWLVRTWSTPKLHPGALFCHSHWHVLMSSLLNFVGSIPTQCSMCHGIGI